MKRRTVTVLVVGIFLMSCLTLVLGAKARSIPPVGTYQMTVEEDGSNVWVLNTSTGDLYRCRVHTQSREAFGGAPE